MSLLYIGQQCLIYFGFFLVITGVFGNGMNIFIFLSTRNYRTTPCTFYFLISSIFNIAYLTINLITRIAMTGLGINFNQTSTAWCKMRQFFLYTLDLISVSCSCLATIDQFFITSQSARLRRLSNIKWARRIVVIVIVIGFLHDVPFVLTQNISPITGNCMNSYLGYAIYTPVHTLCLMCFIPIVVMVIFGYLGYRNIQLTRALAEQRADRQLARTILIQMALTMICFIPYGTNNAYSLITATVSKDSNRVAIEALAAIIISLLFFSYFAASGYTFMISSSRFRRALKDLILFCFRLNRVAPAEQGSIRTSTMNNRTKH